MTMQVDKARLDELIADTEFALGASVMSGGEPMEKYSAEILSALVELRSLRSTDGKEGASLGVAINFAEAYVAEYEFDDGEGGFHAPSEVERLIMLDMINGLFSDDGFVAALTRSPE